MTISVELEWITTGSTAANLCFHDTDLVRLFFIEWTASTEQSQSLFSWLLEIIQQDGSAVTAEILLLLTHKSLENMTFLNLSMPSLSCFSSSYPSQILHVLCFALVKVVVFLGCFFFFFFNFIRCSKKKK